MDMDYSDEDREDDQKLAYYLEIGAIEAAGVSEDGELIFAISEDAKTLAPELWESHMRYVDKTLMELYDADLIRVEYDENLEATISLSEEGVRIATEKGILPVEIPEIPNN